MTVSSDRQKIAILIDLAGAHPESLRSAFVKISSQENVVFAKAYSEMSIHIKDQWAVLLNELNIQIQQSPPASPNSNKPVMLKDLTNLQGSKHYVIGIGSFHTPESVRKSCNDFISIEY